MKIKTVYLKIRGRVQGVGYRWWSKKTAASVGAISGWVRNVGDGSVEIFMRGDEEALDRMIVACRRGPWAARVDDIVFMPPVVVGFLPDITDGKFEII